MTWTVCDGEDFVLFLGYIEVKSSAFRYTEFEMIVEHQSRKIHQEVKQAHSPWLET